MMEMEKTFQEAWKALFGMDRTTPHLHPTTIGLNKLLGDLPAISQAVTKIHFTANRPLQSLIKKFLLRNRIACCGPLRGLLHECM